MAPRGEVGIVVVSLGAGLGLIGLRESSALLVAVVLTTVVAPVLLAHVIPRAVEERRRNEQRARAPADP
jgi:Kef-type K+ transport system membrane component KefB